MKKILILNSYLSTMGGGEKLMMYLCRFFEDYFQGNVKIDILVHNTNRDNVFAKGYVTIEDLKEQFNIELNHTEIKKIDIGTIVGSREYGGGITGSWGERRRTWHTIENVAKEYDLFVNHTYMSIYRGKARKNVYMCMFPPTKLRGDIRVSFIKYMILKLYNRLFYNSYDVFITISQFTHYWLGRYWYKSRKNKIIYPPVFSYDNTADRYDESRKKNIILSVGRFAVIGHSKRQLDMVQWFLQYEDDYVDYEYYVVGAVAENEEDMAYLDIVKRLASKSDRIHIWVNCPYDKLITLYEQAKIFWHAAGYGAAIEKEPENMEHFGITTVEAMSYGIVPVVVDCGGQSEIVSDGVDGYLWETEDECIEYTTKLVADIPLRRKMAMAAVERARAFSVEAFYERNKKVFDKLKV